MALGFALAVVPGVGTRSEVAYVLAASSIANWAKRVNEPLTQIELDAT